MSETSSIDTEPTDEPMDLAKLIRFRQMLQTMLAEIRQLDTDEASLARLATVHNEIEHQLGMAVSEELKAELADFSSCCDQPSPSKSQIRVAQAQLLGWVEGLLNGVQVAARMAQAPAPTPVTVIEEPPDGPDDGDRFGPSTYL